MSREYDGIVVPLIDVDYVTDSEWQFDAPPELLIFLQSVWIVVQDAEITVRDTLANKHPDAFQKAKACYR